MLLHKQSQTENFALIHQVCRKLGTVALLAFLGLTLPGLSFAQNDVGDKSAEGSSAAELSVYEQAQGLWLQCAEKQKASTADSVEGDYLLCNAVYNALGKAIASDTYGDEDVKWLYFYMGRTAASMALVALNVTDSGVSETVCASVERADWTFQKVAPEKDSWEAEVIEQYQMDNLVKTCRDKFGIPQWRQK